ncbi:MAG: xanthine dehydrogenase family protein [Deltaproteobacteria bacterium]|nr:xanthine dehydrogenase family protein [Deltaproteobacteria bacterium]
MKSVGKNIPRLDGYDKVTGKVKYVDDIDIPDCWRGEVVRSDIPYGRIKKINFDKAFDWDKVMTCTYKDIPGKNATIFLSDDQPILAENLVKHVGEAIVLIAAPSASKALEAKKHITIEYDTLDSVLSIEDSRKRKNVIFGKDNIQAKYKIEKGDVKKGFAEADFIVEGEYRTGFHEHAYIETQGMAAIPRPDGGLTVTGSLQCPYYVLKTLKSALLLDETKINVVQAPMGGAFGGKEDYPSLLGMYVALLSIKSGKPVKIIYSRDEDIVVTTKRHPSIVTHKTGVKKDGTITAMEIDVAFEGGAYSTLSPVVLSRGVIHSAGAYKCENTFCTANCYATNNVPTGAFRGFGAPQVFYALEMHIDKVAERIGMSPHEFRLKNCVEVGDRLSTTQLLKESVGAKECLEKVLSAADFGKKWRNNLDTCAFKHLRTKKGIGLSLYMHGGAFTGSGEGMKSEAGLRLNKDGTISVLTGCTDMGQGSHTVLPQIAAESLGVPAALVNTAVPDTAVVPDSGPTVASRTTMIIGSILVRCAEKMKKKLPDLKKRDVKELLKTYYSEHGELKIIERYILPPEIKWDQEKHCGDAYPVYSWAADVAEVSVDAETFEVSVDKLTVAVDVGRAVNPVLVEGQMEGGTLQALGWALMEDCIYKNGKPVNNRFQTYIIPTAKDAPEWKTIIVEKPFSYGPFGAKGIGELPLDGGAPAIANAIYNATGLRITSLPITPEKLYSLYEEKNKIK